VGLTSTTTGNIARTFLHTDTHSHHSVGKIAIRALQEKRVRCPDQLETNSAASTTDSPTLDIGLDSGGQN
jgi:hypothetical protein